MDTPLPKKSFKSLVAKAQKEAPPEINIRSRVRLALSAETELASALDFLDAWITPKWLSLVFAASFVALAFSGFQLLAGLSLLEDALFFSPLVWL